MAAAVAALAAPLLLLTFSALLNDSDLPEYSRLPDTVHDSSAEQVLRGVLASQRSDEPAFRQHRELAERFIAAAASRLRQISPLFAGATVNPDGGAYEDTCVSNAADFDMYTVLAAAPLREFELQRGEDGSFAVRLRSGAARDDLPDDLTDMMTEDGYLDAGKFKQWTTECLLYALYETAEKQPDLQPVVYHSRGAPGVNLTAADGATVEIDFTAKLPLPPVPQESPLRPAALQPCGVPVVPPGVQPSWHLYSSAGVVGRFGADAPQLELSLVRAAPLLRDVIRLLKTLRERHDWYHRFHVKSFQLKQAAFWAWSESCETETGLLPATVDALRHLERALRGGRLEHFWFSVPTENVLHRRVLAPQLAEEVARCVETLTSGDQQSIRRLFLD